MESIQKYALGKTLLCLASVLYSLSPAQAQVGLPTGPTDGGLSPTNNPVSDPLSLPDMHWHAKIVDWSSTEWTKMELATNPVVGGYTTNVHKYTEVGDGINFIDANTSSSAPYWKRSVDEIQLLTTNAMGGAAASEGPTRVWFAPTLGSDGMTVQLTSRSNVVLQLRPMAIYLEDSTNSFLLANIRPDAEGELLPPRTIIYKSVTTNGIACNIVFEYSHGIFESHLLILSQPAATPEALGLDPATARISLVHLVDGPLPTQTPITTLAGLADTRLDFSGLSFPEGRAFLIGDSSDTNAPAQIQLPGSADDTNAIPVTKRVIPIGPNEWGLSEEVRWSDIRPKLENLPPYSPGASLSTPLNRTRRASLEWPKPAPKKAKAGRSKPMRVASSGYHPKAVDIDFITISGGGSYSFLSGQTYFLSSSATFTNVSLYGGCVIKETNGASLTVNGPINCYGNSTAPSIISSWCDLAFGENNLPGATGYQTYSGAPAIHINYSPQQTLNYLKIRWAQTGVQCDQTTTLGNSSLEWCQTGVWAASNATVYLSSSTKCTVTTPTAGGGTFNGSLSDICVGNDSNGLPYSYEYEYFGSNGIPASADSDQDGFSNAQEYTNNTSPLLYDGPRIQEQPQAQLVAQGNTASFSVIASGTGTLSYQWYKGGQPIAGATNTSYTISSAQLINSDNYFVVITNLYGVVSSTLANLSVAIPTSGVPAPVGITGWWTGNNTNIDSVSTNNGIFSGSYVAGEVANAFSVVSTATAVRIPKAPALNIGAGIGLTVEGWINSADSSWRPVFEWAPTNSYGVHVWVNFQFSGCVWVNLADTSGNSHTFQSAQNLITNGVFQHLAMAYDKTSGYMQVFVNGSLKTNVFMGVFAPQTTPDLWLGCRPTTVDGTAYSFNGPIDEASIYNRALNAGEIQAIYNAGTAGKYLSPGAPAITNQPQTVNVTVGNSATFTVGASGVSPLSYQWMFNGAAISGATSSSYTISSVEPVNDGAYTVVVGNKGGSTLSSSAFLNLTNSCIDPPTNMISWWRAESNANDQMGINNGQWNGLASYTNGEAGQAFSFGGAGSGGTNYVTIASSASLQLSNAFSIELWFDDVGSSSWYGLLAKRSATSPYRCNYGINALAGNRLQVYFLDPNYGGFQILTNPLPSTGSFHHVAATYQQINSSQVQLQVYVDGKFGGSGTFSGNLANTFDNSPVTIGADNATGDFFKGYIDEATLYSRVLSATEITNLYRAATSGKCTAPVIITQPASQTVAQGANATFSVVAYGTAPLSYQWRFNGANLSGATQSSLTINNAQPGNAGDYSVVVSNLDGTATSTTAVLTVLTPPSIVTQPVNQLAPPGANVTFTVTASGSIPISYQWNFNCQPIPGAISSSYNIPSAQQTNEGIYCVQVSNAAGSVLSTNALLTLTTCITAPSNLISWWRAEGDATDAVGGNDGKLVAGTGFTTGVVGQGFNNSFYGYVKVPSTPSLQLTNAFTVEFWYKDTGVETYWVALVGKCSPISQNLNIELLANTNITVGYLDPITGGNSTLLYSAPAANVFHHVAATYQQLNSTNVQIQLYIDGTFRTNGTYAGNLANTLNNAPFTIGDAAPTGGFLTGIIDEVSLYSRVLTTNEIAAIYAAGAGGYGKCVPTSVTNSFALQPTNQTVSAGSDVMLTALSTGLAPLHYQWYSSNATVVAIASATNRVFITNTLPVGTNYYFVTASSGSSSTNSALMKLSVTNAVCTTAPANVVGWWKGETNTTDQMGGNNGFLMYGAGYTNGIAGEAFYIPGYQNPSYVSVPSSPTLKLTNGFTYELWYKGTNINGTGGGVYSLLCKYQMPGSCSCTKSSINYANFLADDYWVGIGLGDTNYGYQSLTYWPAPQPAMFHHLAATYNQITSTNVQVMLYIDGQPVLTNSLLGNLANALSDTPVTLGATYPPVNGYNASFPGIIDEPTIYSRVLTNTEILAIYNAGSAGKCLTSFAPQIILQPTNQTVALGTDVMLTVFATGTPNLSYQWQFEGANIAGATNATYIISEIQFVQAGSYSVLVSNAQGSTSSQTANLTVTAAPPCVIPPTGLVSWWQAESNANDFVGTNSGSWVGTAAYAAGKVNQAFSFNGGNYVQIPDSASLDLTNAFTVELWYKDTGSPASGYRLISKSQNTAPLASSFDINVLPNGYIQAGFYDTNHYWQFTEYAPVPIAGMFHHVAATFVQTNSTQIAVNLYIDGQCASGGTFTGNLTNTLSTAPVTIGSYGPAGGNMIGIVDEASIYSRALSPSEIQAIYNAGMSGKCINAMPFVQITSPTNSQTFQEKTNITVTVTDYDVYGPISQIQLFWRSNFTDVNITTITNPASTFSFVWSNRLVDQYVIGALAFDARNVTNHSSLVEFQVTPSNPPPTVSITYPTSNSVFAAGSDITITALASATNATVTNVQFFINSVPAGIDTTNPYSVTRCCWTPGNYVLLALATDSLGHQKVSAPVNIQVAASVSGSGGGFWDATFVVPYNSHLDTFSSVLALFPSAPNLYVGGFWNISALNSDGILRWDGTNWNTMGLTHLLGVHAIAQDGNTIYAGGRAQSQPNAVSIVSWDGNTTWTQLGNLLTGAVDGYGTTVRCISLIAGDVYIGGDFTSVPFLAKLNRATSQWVQVGPSLTGPVNAIAAINDNLFIGGEFTNVGSAGNASYVAQLKGNDWVILGTGVGGTNTSGNSGCVWTLAACGTNLFVGGDFTTAGGNTNANGIARWNTVSWSPIHAGLGANTNAPSYTDNLLINAISTRGDTIYVGGQFRGSNPSPDSTPAWQIARATWSEQLQDWVWSPLDLGVYATMGPTAPQDGIVNVTTIMNGPTPSTYDLFVGGSFQQAGFSDLLSAVNVARWSVGKQTPTNVPVVTITLPVADTIFTNPPTTSVTLKASVNPDPGGFNVFFYVDGQQIGFSGSQGNYSAAWSSPTAGPHLASAATTGGTSTMVVSPAVPFKFETSTTIQAKDDFFVVFANSPPTALPVLTNDSSSSPLKIISADQQLIPALGMTGLGTVSVSYDQQSLIFTPMPNYFGTNILGYTVTNSSGLSDHASVTVAVRALPYPLITQPLDGTKTNATANLTIAGNVVDYDGTVAGVAVYTNGYLCSNLTPTSSNTFSTTWSQSVPGFYTFVALATDSYGYTNPSPPVTVEVQSTSPTNHLPFAMISSPAPTNNVLGASAYTVRDGQITNMVGSAYDPDAGDSSSWQIVLVDPNHATNAPLYNVTPGPLNSQGYHNGSVSNANFGTLDLSVVQNGGYLLTLNARGGGDITSVNVPIAVESNLKIGQFSFSEQDLVVPVNGIPLTVTRTYNSLNPLSSDFGYSWTFSINDMDIQLDEQRQPVTVGVTPQVIDADIETDANGLPLATSIRNAGGWDVTLTLPDGRRTTFAFNPRLTADSHAYAQWTPPADVHATLTNYPFYITGSTPSGLITILPPPAQPIWADEDISYGPPPFSFHDIPGWMLQTQDGTQYYISRGAPNMITYDTTGNGNWANIRVYGLPQLTNIVERTGDQIIITTNSIYHLNTNGFKTHTVWFDRDAQNRITAIHDPVGGSNGLPVIQYIYNQNSGNLIQVLKLTDRVAGTYTTNKYFYSNQQFPHYITEIDNGIGAPIVRNFYDSSGRLVQTEDANNNITQYIHNLTNSLELVVDPLGHTNTLAYDSRGNVTAMTNSLNSTRLASYDSANNKTSEIAYTNGAPYATNLFTYDPSTASLLSSVNALGFTNTFSYNPYGQLTNAIDSRGGSSTNYFDANGNLIGTSDALGNSTTNLYDTNSLLVSTTDSVGTVTTNQYDSLGNLVFTRTGYYSNNTFVALTSTGYAYDSNGNRVAMTNGLGVVTCYGFDGQNRIIATTNNAYGTMDQTVIRTIYDAVGRVTQTVDALGVTNVFAYDFAGHQTSVTRALGTPVQQVIQSGFDSVGNKTNTIDNLGRETDFLYDALNRQTVKLFPAATSGGTRTGITNAYDGLNRRVAVTNQAGLGMGFQFDVSSRLITVTNALGKLTQYQWDALGNETNQIDAMTHSTKFAFDALSRRTQRTMPGTQAEGSAYDAASRLIAQTNFDGTVITNQYDALGRLVKRCNGATVLETYAYSAMGQLTNRTDASGTFTWVYDALGRLKTNSTPVGTLYYTYDANGNLLTLSSATANGVSLTYQYDALNRLTNVIDNRLTGNKNTGYGFDGVGNLQSLSYPNGITNLWQYDGLNRLTNLTWKLSGAQRGDFAYQLGPAGNRTNLVDNVNGTSRTFSWGYDNLYRLTNETVSGASPTGTLGYVYDDVGNRTSRTGTLGSLTASNNTFDVNDSVSGLVFDANGNTRTNGSVYYGYDWANRLTSQTNGAAVLSMVYDADGNRIQRTSAGTTTLYLVATVNPSGYPQVVEEFTVSGGTTNLSMVYTYGLGLISQRQSNGTVSFFGADGLGSTRFLTSTSGTITDTYAYDAFGTVIASAGSTPNNYLYTGQQSDPVLGLLYLRKRYDIPSLGRLLTRDADEGVPFDPLTLHKYVYAADNPVNKIDPSGNDFVDVMASLYVQAQLATATFFATHGALAETAILVGAISAYNSAQLLSTGIDPDTGEPATVLAAAFGIMDFLPAGEFITKPLGKSAKKLYRAAAVNIWDGLAKVKRTIEDQVHHRIPLEWAHLFPDRNPNRIANLQLIKRDIHEGPNGVSAAWTQFRNSLGGRTPSAQEVLDKAAEVDSRFGANIKTLE